jgi:hypothetical protein
VRDRIDPIGQALINLYPLPNFTCTTPGCRNNYVATGLQPINRNQQNLRIDYSVSKQYKALRALGARVREQRLLARALVEPVGLRAAFARLGNQLGPLDHSKPDERHQPHDD